MKSASKRPSVSICIPAYEMGGMGPRFLREALESLTTQTFQDFEVIVSDHCVEPWALKAVCDLYGARHFRFGLARGSSSANANHAIAQARGKYIKILFQDDFLATNESLATMMRLLDQSQAGWLVSGCVHTDQDASSRSNRHSPTVQDMKQLALGHNDLGAPSTLLYRKSDVSFDPNLIWLMDCLFYYHLFRRFGWPYLHDEPLVVIRVWSGSVTKALVTGDIIDREQAYVADLLQRE